MQTMGDGQRQLQQSQFPKVGRIKDHEIGVFTLPVPHQFQHPSVVISGGTGPGGHQRLTHKPMRCGTPDPTLTRAEIELLD